MAGPSDFLLVFLSAIPVMLKVVVISDCTDRDITAEFRMFNLYP
jgi:hypothetical protein